MPNPLPTSEVRLTTFREEDQITEETSVPVRRGYSPVRGVEPRTSFGFSQLPFRLSPLHRYP
jgi:hypothetical protein